MRLKEEGGGSRRLKLRGGRGRQGRVGKDLAGREGEGSLLVARRDLVDELSDLQERQWSGLKHSRS